MRSQYAHDDDFPLGDALKSPTEREGLDERGNPVGPDDPECVARSAKDVTTGKCRFAVRVAADGPEAGRFYNPKSIFGRPHRPDAVSRSGNARFAWRGVSAEAFDAYVKFLCTGNLVFLRSAERAT